MKKINHQFTINDKLTSEIDVFCENTGMTKSNLFRVATIQYMKLYNDKFKPVEEEVNDEQV